jgi:glutathione peroxidase
MVLGHVVTSIDGLPTDLAQFKGKVVLIVNVASQCGLTPQYEGLQALYAKHREAGLVVLGFPCNDFMGQEPGTEADIAKFCSTRYSVTFPMLAKVAVKGPATAPLYKQLIAQPAPIGGELEWNFTKFLVGRDGRVFARFGPRVAPSDPKLTAAIERALAVPAPADAGPPSTPPAAPPAAPAPGPKG